MVTQSPNMKRANNDTNRSLVGIFSTCLSTPVIVYSTLAIRQFLEHATLDTGTLLMTSLRTLLGVAALFVILYPPWLARHAVRKILVNGRNSRVVEQHNFRRSVLAGSPEGFSNSRDRLGPLPDKKIKNGWNVLLGDWP